MRELKFRAWDKKSRCWHKNWGSLFPWGTYEGDSKHIKIGVMPEYFEFMQYTGLKDKNGKEIYEGDLLQSPKGDYEPREIFTVKFEEGGFSAWHEDKLHNGRQAIWGTNFDEVEVIGNIYENPELVK